MSAPTFAQAATSALRRVLLRRWVRLLGRTAPMVLSAFIVLTVARFLTPLGPWLSVGLFIGWLGITAGLVWRQRPGAYAALAFWDEQNKRHEAFATAWWFEQQATLTDAAQLHLRTQREQLPAALTRLAHDLPLQPRRIVFGPALVCVLSLLASMARPLAPGDTRLTEQMRGAAAQEAKKLADNTLSRKPLAGLSDTEKKDVEKLKQDVRTTAKSIEQGDAGTARGLLSDLEKRAREAEKLAEKLGTNTDAWASNKLIAALRAHADTADLGDALASKNAPQAGNAAQALSDQLKAKDLSAETRDRLNATLDDVAKASETADRKSFAGEPILAASDALRQQDTTTASEEFAALAEKMSNTARREQSRKELEKLAQQLRDAGSRIAGQNGGGMENMAQSGQNNAPQAGAQQQQQQTLQAPGLGQPQDLAQAPTPNQTGQPPPGSMSAAQAQLAQGQMGQQNNAPPGEGSPVLLAPIPGMKPDQPPGMTLILPNAPNMPPTGSAPMPAGPKAGSGTAKLDNTPTVPQKAGKTGVVDARPAGTDGPSSKRSIEGGIRSEAAGRDANATTLELIKEQEAALDDTSLPPARREQVRRYFTELRKRFEQK